MLLDKDREVYTAFGLKISLSKVWMINSLVYYADQKLAGKKLIAVLDDDDPHQLGGDFIVNSKGKLVMVYPSKDFADRPTIEYLLNSAKSQQDNT